MSKRPRIGALGLLVILPLVMAGCGREHRLPTAASPPKDFVAPAPKLDAPDERVLETTRGRGHQHLIAEAKGALGAVLTGEQVYFQKSGGTYTDVPDTADLRVTLGVYLGEVLRRWAFSVSEASDTGFVATARGLPHTTAHGIVVTLRFVRGQPPSWTVEDARHDHGNGRPGEPHGAIIADAIAQAKGALGAVYAGERIYYQKWNLFTDAADTAAIRLKLDVSGLDAVSRQWTFSVSGASPTGFLAKAQGREDTDAEGIAVTLNYQLGQPVVLAVQRRRPRH